jgi:hypothetical protein
MTPLLIKAPPSSGQVGPLYLPLKAVCQVWGLEVPGTLGLGGTLPAPIATRMVLQLDDEAGGGPAGCPGGEAQPPLPAGPFQAVIRFDLLLAKAGGRRASLRAKLHSLSLQRAVVGLERRGLRRLDAGTVALVVARPLESSSSVRAPGTCVEQEEG